mmetsp:Transcript_13399/g.42337  ORF Transcript_13399/g.42337 Transcript_13399/m.42337 type:complete len:230 (+) Transcript_13399:328-1017(+)
MGHSFIHSGAVRSGGVVEVVEVGVGEGGLGGDSIVRGVLEAGVDEVEAGLVEARNEVGEVEPGPVREGDVVVAEVGDAVPEGVGGGAEDAEDLEELVDLAVARKHGLLGDHFDDDGPDGPHVHGRGVGLRAEEDLGRAVPEGDDLVRERSDGRAERASETEISHLQDAVLGDEEVLGLEVAVHDAAHVAEGDAAEHLEGEGLDLARLERSVDRVQVPLQVLVEELEDQV